MAAKNQVFQKVGLDSKEYLSGLRAISKEQQETTVRVAKALSIKKRAHHEASEEIKKKNLDIIKSMKEVGKAFTENLKKGTVIAGGVAVASAFKSSIQDAAKSLLSLDQGMARLQSRFDLNREKVKSLGKELRTLATVTGVNGGSIAKAAEELMSASGKRKQAIGIDSVAKFSAMGGGEAPDVARMVIDYLKGSGQKLTEDNVKNLLTGAVSTNRGGDISLSDSLKALTMDPSVKAKLGLSNQENSAMIAAASGVGQNRGTSISGLNALFSKAVGGFGEGAALSGIFGVGSFMKNGKFDMGKLGQASQNLEKQGLNRNDFIKLMESTGLNGDEAEGIYSILKDFKSFDASFKSVLKDQKTLEESFSQSTDNLPDTLSKLNEKIAKATHEILSPGANVLKQLARGEVAGAAGSIPGAIGSTASSAWENKEMVALGIGGLALSGAIATKLGGLFGGVSKGLAVDQATQGKVQAVYVVNLKELSGSFGGAGIAPGSGIIPKLLSALPAIGTTAGLGLAAYAGHKGTEALMGESHSEQVARYGTDTPHGFRKLPERTRAGSTGPSFENSNAMMDKMLSVFSALKLKVEVVDQSSRFTAPPSILDLVQQN